MDLFKTLTRNLGKKTPVTDFGLQAIRFRKLVRTTYQLLKLFEDGREKIKGEYILDYKYVQSVAEGILDRMGKLVFDASVLVANEGRGLYQIYDAYQELLRNTLRKLETALADRSGGGESLADEPEYKTLNEILSWFDKGGADNPVNVKQFINQVFEQTLPVFKLNPKLLEKSAVTDIHYGNSAHRLYILDPFAGEDLEPEQAPKIKQCKPLNLLWPEVEAHSSDDLKSPSAQPVPWLAAMGKYNLSLYLANKPTPPLHFEIFPDQATGLGMIFLFIDKHYFTDLVLENTYFETQTGTGKMVWLADAAEETMENNLKYLGKKCLALQNGHPDQ